MAHRHLFSFVVREKAGIRLEKTWRENFFVVAREVKIFGTKTKNFSRVFSPKHAPQSDRFRLVICRQQEASHQDFLFLNIGIGIIFSYCLRSIKKHKTEMGNHLVAPCYTQILFCRPDGRLLIFKYVQKVRWYLTQNKREVDSMLIRLHVQQNSIYQQNQLTISHLRESML
ncbi:Protein of unknown function (DUF1661) [Porphyromonas gingivalis AJW4]|nr:Protein of unknown function (DUF1661) [Porphyromonas gingivalis AJW4]